MTSTFSRTRRIELLLNSLIGEQHARRALLAEVCEELAKAPELAPVLEAALRFLVRLEEEPFTESAYTREVERLMEAFHVLSFDPTPGPARAKRDERSGAPLAAAS